MSNQNPLNDVVENHELRLRVCESLLRDLGGEVSGLCEEIAELCGVTPKLDDVMRRVSDCEIRLREGASWTPPDGI